MAKDDDRKQLVLRYADDVLTHQRYDLLQQYVTPDFVDHFGGDIEGPAALTARMQEMHRAFDGLEFNVLHVLAEDDIVAVHFRVPGTHVDEFAGVPGSGCEVMWRGVMIYRIAGNRIAEGWGYWNVVDIISAIRAAAAFSSEPEG